MPARPARTVRRRRDPVLASGRVRALHGAQRPDLGHRLRIAVGELCDRPFKRADAAREPPDRPGGRGGGGGPTGAGWPGLPTRVGLGGTWVITTLSAPIFAPCPIVIGPGSFAPEPI